MKKRWCQQAVRRDDENRRRVRLAKDRFDVGLLTADPAVIEFMTEDVGLGDFEVLPITKGVTQYRFDVDGSVVKVNIVPALTATVRSGYSGIVVADEMAETARTLTGPDGIEVMVAPVGHRGVGQLGVRLAIPDLARAQAYFGETLGWEVVDATARLGASVVLLEPRADAPVDVPMTVCGWTYLTAQIWECDVETRAALSRGATLTQAPRTMGETARFSMISDPWGNQLELSQRASLTGPVA